MSEMQDEVDTHASYQSHRKAYRTSNAPKHIQNRSLSSAIHMVVFFSVSTPGEADWMGGGAAR